MLVTTLIEQETKWIEFKKAEEEKLFPVEDGKTPIELYDTMYQ